MSDVSRPPAGDLFATTRWSVVRRAVEEEGPAAGEALSHLCAASWYPIYAFIRRSGKSAHDAEDLTQGFFERLLEKNFFAAADRERGRLRAFLLTCVKRHLADEHDRAMAAKRGGGRVIVFSAATAEELYAAEPVDTLTPDRLYQRRWALNLIDATMTALRENYARGRQGGALSRALSRLPRIQCGCRGRLPGGGGCAGDEVEHGEVPHPKTARSNGARC